MLSGKKKIFIISSLLVIVLFIIWNLVWLVVTNNRYNSFLEAVPKSQFGNHIMKKEGYVYNVKRPGYLSFTGNLGVNNPEQGSSLIIWPLISGGYEYGVRIQTEKDVYEIYMDDELNPIENNNELKKQLINEFKPEITALLDKANTVWKLD